MKDQLKELKKKYDGKSVAVCVKTAKNFNQKLIENGRELVLLLWYLEKTKRYKEYKGYEKMPFDVFISEVCLVPYNRYRQMAYAYNWFPEESKKYGPQTIQRIRQKVDSVSKIPKVLAEINKGVEKAKDPLQKRQVIHNAIEKYSAPPKKSTSSDTKAYWRSEAKRWEKVAGERWEEIRKLNHEINELKSQLAKQSGSVKKFIKIREFFENEMPAKRAAV
jgi:hypothetical protein